MLENDAAAPRQMWTRTALCTFLGTSAAALTVGAALALGTAGTASADTGAPDSSTAKSAASGHASGRTTAPAKPQAAASSSSNARSATAQRRVPSATFPADAPAPAAAQSAVQSSKAVSSKPIASTGTSTRTVTVSNPASTGTTTTVATSAASTTTAPPYFPAATWLWNPIASNAATAGNSALWVSYLSAAGTQHVANMYQYGVTLVKPSSVTGRTARYSVSFTANWGPNPFGSNKVPIPSGTKIPTGSDGQIAVMDPVTGNVYGIWQAKYNSKKKTWSGTWGGMTPINGNGIDTSGSATATGISRYAGVITATELTAAVAANTGLNHALVTSSNIAGPGFVGPAIKSDGTNIAGVATPIPEGYRLQLDPTINIDAIPGITPAEKVVAKTLQTYGAYIIDQGGSALAFQFELLSDATSTSKPGSAWTAAGLSWDYYDMAHIPWSQLRVVAA